MEEHRVRISDIAEELGLSTATVSNVLHGKTKKISDETVRRVSALLEERQYIPSMAGILLAQNSSKIIGIAVNDHEKYESHTLEDVFIASSINQLSTEIEKNGQFMMVKKTTDIEEIIRFASMWNMEGLVLIGYCEQDYMYLRDHMRIPFVVYDGFCERTDRICNIIIDNFDGGFQAGTYLKHQGHKRALCVSDNNICMDKERFDGFQAGFGDNAELMLIPMHMLKRKNFYLQNFDKLCSVSAIFAVSDYYAIDLIHFLNEQNLKVPEDISVIGFDDTPMCQMMSPQLTSIRQDVSMRAQIAIQKLRELKEKKETETTIMLPVTLIERGSVRRLDK
ncbi:MAG: LacI family DNA-binding transcriptional regulator [Lachnospiraceae bacterium]|nr:LacI family DNA-binding transcriptional regulator [Lachnospiraceae bacterium]